MDLNSKVFTIPVELGKETLSFRAFFYMNGIPKPVDSERSGTESVGNGLCFKKWLLVLTPSCGQCHLFVKTNNKTMETIRTLNNFMKKFLNV